MVKALAQPMAKLKQQFSNPNILKKILQHKHPKIKTRRQASKINHKKVSPRN
jgi:hypothetical protein